MNDKKYRTRPANLPKNYNEVIVNNSANREKTLCVLSNDMNQFYEGYVVADCRAMGNRYEYWCEDLGMSFIHATPLESKTVLRKKKASEIVKWLEERGYKFDGECFGRPTGLSDVRYNCNIFKGCGEEASLYGNSLPDDWYEEVEI